MNNGNFKYTSGHWEYGDTKIYYVTSFEDLCVYYKEERMYLTAEEHKLLYKAVKARRAEMRKEEEEKRKLAQEEFNTKLGLISNESDSESAAGKS